MGKKIAWFTVLACLAAGAALAADTGQEKKQGPTISEWLTSMQRKIESMVPRKTLSTSTGVAGVRGAKEDQQAKLYWKGKKSEETVTEDELKEFQEGLEFAAKGDKVNAVRELEEFMKQYPDSQLIPDAKKTLDLVKQQPEGAAVKSAAAASESAPAKKAAETSAPESAGAAPAQ